MPRAATSIFRPASNPAADTLPSAAGLATVAGMCRELKKVIFDPYRPELHYMRGPGPKWHEKRAAEKRPRF
jgi:hypothetical protein